MKHNQRNIFLLALGIGVLLISLMACKATPTTPTTPPDTTAPLVVSVAPISASLNVALNSIINVTFNEAMDPATIINTNFHIVSGSSPVVGTVMLDASGTTALFVITAGLASSTSYTATITTGAKDLAGNALAADTAWTFTTGSAVDATAPSLVAMVPLSGSVDVPLNATINATFSEGMNPATMNSSNFKLTLADVAVAGAVSTDSLNKTVVFTPSVDLAPNSLYTVTATTGFKDLAANPLGANVAWTFTTGAAPDINAPTIVSVYPDSAATGVPINTEVVITFNKGMDTSTINTTNITLSAGANPVTGTVLYNLPQKSARFTPASNLSSGTSYTAKVSTAVKDVAGNALAAEKTWSFTTLSATVAAGPPPVRLGTAGSFAILAKTAISTVPASAITGDIGVSPAAETYLTGFSQTKATGYSTAPQVTGFMYAADMTPPTPSNMTVAVADMETAYTDAAGRPAGVGPNLNAGGGTIGGLTFAPGVYTWGSNVEITTDIYLAGGANDVWIFQISNDLNLATGKKIILSNGAKAKNIFWQVAGIATLEAGAQFQGIILSQTQIILKTGATLTGRALAQSQVTLDQSTVTEPSL